MRRPEWLTREAERWETDGVITPAQRQAILDRYPSHDEQLTSRTLVWLAWLVAGFGFILLVTWNWATIDVRLKLGGTIAVALALFVSAWQASRRGQDRRAELLAFAGALAAGAVSAAVAEWLNLPRTNTMPLLFWSLAIAVTALSVASPITTALGAGVLAFWAMTETGRPPAPWEFMFVFPFLAVAAERRTNPYSAGVLTLAFGTWVVLIGLDTWKASSIPGVMMLAAGGALDVWAHLPQGRRPAFARATPALGLVVAGLTFQGVAALQGAAPPMLWGDPAIVVPGATLLVALTMVALWPSSAQKAARGRPLMFGGLVVLWIVLSLIAGGRAPQPTWWSWVWIALPSVALVVLAVSAIREGADMRDRGLFAIGVAAMIALVVMQFSDEANQFGRSAVVLFTAAGVLFWASRTLRPTK